MRSITIVLMGLLSYFQAFCYEKEDSTMNVQLNEVVVKAETIINKGDHQVLLLNKDNREFGTNALDAISSLPLFETKLDETSLISWDRKEVFILINGVPATGYDLRSYKSDDIKNVKYYSTTPAEYLSFTQGPVIDVIVKKRHDRLYTGYFNAVNAVTTGFGTNQANLSYTDSLNMFRTDYLIDYRNINNIKTFTEYNYPNNNISKYSGEGKNSGCYNNINVSYQRYQGSHLFNAKLSYLNNNSKEFFHRTEFYDFENSNYFGKGEKLLKSDANTYSIDLYYRYLFSKTRFLMLNIVNTFGDASSFSSQNMTHLDDSPSEQDYDIYSSLNNNNYSFIGNALFVSRIFGARFSLTTFYKYRRMKQEYEGGFITPKSHNMHTYMSLCWFLDNSITIYPTVGVTYNSTDNATMTKSDVFPYFRFYADWWGKNKLKGTSIQLTAGIIQQSPSLGALANGYSYIDKNFVSIGNSELKNYWTMHGKLAFLYFVPNSTNNIQLVFVPEYSHNNPVSCIFEENDVFYLKPTAIKDFFKFDTFLRGVYAPAKWISIEPYIEHNYTRYNTPAENVSFSYWRFGGSIVLRHKSFTSVLSANSPTKIWDGDVLERGSTQLGAEVQYKFKSWSFGAKYNYSGHNNFKLASLEKFRYYNDIEYSDLHTLFRLSASYSFSVGKARRHDTKKLNNQDIDTGLGKYNQPEIPK
ncbi:MAG: hypothetical protein ACI31F_02945 [Muribaculaceae bacterium]